MATITLTDKGKFTECPKKVQEYLVGKEPSDIGEYLQAKMANSLGKPKKDITLDTAFTLKDTGNEEGVIKGMDALVKGLRIDRQKSQKIDGNSYATFQIQWGTGMDGTKGGAYGGALVRLNSTFSIKDLRDALRKSLENKVYYRIDP